MWDLHSGKRIGKTDRKGAFTVAQDGVAAHPYYIGEKSAAGIPR